jgi:hypothetical protein
MSQPSTTVTGQSFIDGYLSSASHWMDEKGIYPTPMAVKVKGDRLELHALALPPDQVVIHAFQVCKRRDVGEQVFALDTYCKPGQGTTLDSCLVIFHLKRGAATTIGVMEYSWNGGQPIIKEVNWDNSFWNRKYADLAGRLSAAFPRIN